MRSFVDRPLVIPLFALRRIALNAFRRAEVALALIAALVPRRIIGRFLLDGFVTALREHSERVVVGRNHILHLHSPQAVMVVTGGNMTDEVQIKVAVLVVERRKVDDREYFVEVKVRGNVDLRRSAGDNFAVGICLSRVVVVAL